MKLVLKYNISDDYTYSCDVTIPLEYESAEAALVDLDNLVCMQSNVYTEFGFAGYTLNSRPFGHIGEDGKMTFFGAHIMTIDEWFTHELPHLRIQNE